MVKIFYILLVLLSKIKLVIITEPSALQLLLSHYSRIGDPPPQKNRSCHNCFDVCSEGVSVSVGLVAGKHIFMASSPKFKLYSSKGNLLRGQDRQNTLFMRNVPFFYNRQLQLLRTMKFGIRICRKIQKNS